MGNCRNLFGTFEMYFGNPLSRFKWNETVYDAIPKFCAAIPNHHIVLQPIRTEDGPSYKLHRNQLDQGEIVIIKKRQSGRENFARFWWHQWKGRTIRARFHRLKARFKMFSGRDEMFRTDIVNYIWLKHDIIVTMKYDIILSDLYVG